MSLRNIRCNENITYNGTFVILTQLFQIELLQELLVIQHLILVRIQDINVLHVNFGFIFIFVNVDPSFNIFIELLLFNQPVKLPKFLLFYCFVWHIPLHKEFSYELVKILVLHTTNVTLSIRSRHAHTLRLRSCLEQVYFLHVLLELLKLLALCLHYPDKTSQDQEYVLYIECLV